MAAHSLASERASFKYPVKRAVLSPFVVPYKSNKANIASICKGVMPRRVICGFLETSAFDGAIKENPLEFKHCNVKSLKLNVNSKSLPNSTGLKLDYINDNYLDGYRSLTRISKDLDISYLDYKGSYALYAFDLTPDISS